MPRFSENERDVIKQKLQAEGERLFSAYGVKKVTVDELVVAAGIAKGSFYAFYPTKEQLFMEILANTQNKMWADMDGFLKAFSSLQPRVLMKHAFFWMLEQMERYPLMRRMDSETANYLFRKLPKEVVEAHTKDDGAELLHLAEYGIHFNCDIPTAAKIFQTVAMSFFNLSGESKAVRKAVMNTIVDGVLREIVRDEP